MKSITIKPDEITALAEESGKFIFKPEAENSLMELLKIQAFINQAVEDVKVAIAKAGTDINPGFKGVIGEGVSCTYRAYGGKYKYDWAKKDQAMPFLKEKVTHYVDGDKIAAYVKEVGELPDGIDEVVREKSLSISVKDK